MSDRAFESFEGLWGELMFVMHDPEHLQFVNTGRGDWFESLDIPGRRVLDLGSGNGYFDLELGSRGYEVVAVDQVATIVDAAKQMQTDDSVEFVTSDLRHVQFDSDSFDVVTMFGLLGLNHYFSNRFRAQFFQLLKEFNPVISETLQLLDQPLLRIIVESRVSVRDPIRNETCEDPCRLETRKPL